MAKEGGEDGEDGEAQQSAVPDEVSDGEHTN